MSLHKIFNELKKLEYDDFDLLCDCWREYYNIKINCQNMGIRYSDKFLINSVHKRVNGKVNPSFPVPPSATPSNRDKKIEQIILGDNLDIIEEAAKKKGLL